MKKYLTLLMLAACATGAAKLGDTSKIADNSTLDFTNINSDMKLMDANNKPVSGTYKTALGKVTILYTYKDGELTAEEKYVEGLLKAKSENGSTTTFFQDGTISGRTGRAKIARKSREERKKGEAPEGIIKVQYYSDGKLYSEFKDGYTNYYHRNGDLIVREKLEIRSGAPRLLDMLSKTYYDKNFRAITGKVVLACPQYPDVACETFSVENGILSGPYTKFEDLNGFYNEGLSRLWVMNYDRTGKVGKVLDLSSAEDAIISSEVYYFDDNTRFSLIYDGFNGPLTGVACGNMYINTKVFSIEDAKPVLDRFNTDRSKNPCTPSDLVVTEATAEIVAEAVEAAEEAAEDDEPEDAGEVVED
ncbi:MAG: hypothetical protein LBL52_04675 [Rickettsiales bacterium]|jgi:hypothetical protein|nr:hypothetical protein [Rickettsiales bacterium]